MASTIIHYIVAQQLLPTLNIKNKNDYLLGSIAPDLSTELHEDKAISHFYNKGKEKTPDIDKFIEKYKNFKENDFDLGYFIHLYTDKLWKENIYKKSIKDGYIYLLNGDKIKIEKGTTSTIIYQDYDKLNIPLIKKYQVDLSLFKDKNINPNTTINEIPIDKLHLLLKDTENILKNSKEKETIFLDKEKVIEFIDTSKEKLLEALKKY